MPEFEVARDNARAWTPPTAGGLAPLARWLGVTEGQLYTLAIGLLLVVTVAALGLPSLRDRASSRFAADDFGERAPTSEPVASAVEPQPASEAAPRTPDTPSRTAASTPAPPGDPRGGSGADPGIQPFDDGGALGSASRFAGLPGRGLVGGVAASPDGRVWVGRTDEDGRVTVVELDAAGGFVRALPVGHADAARSPQVDLDPAGSLVVVAGTTSVWHVATDTGLVSTLAEIPDLPPCLLGPASSACEPGAIDHPPGLLGVARDSSGALYLADAPQAAIWRVEPRRDVELWFSGAQLMGLDGAGPAALATDREDNVLVAVTASLLAGTAPAVYRFEVEDDGSAGSVSQVLTAGRGADPAGLVVGATGRLYLALRGASSVAVHEPDGRAVATYPTSGSAVVRPGGIAFRGRSVLVSTQPDGDERGVVRIFVDERAARSTRDHASAEEGGR